MDVVRGSENELAGGEWKGGGNGRGGRLAKREYEGTKWWVAGDADLQAADLVTAEEVEFARRKTPPVVISRGSRRCCTGTCIRMTELVYGVVGFGTAGVCSDNDRGLFLGRCSEIMSLLKR